jgi:hypothetical protein
VLFGGVLLMLGAAGAGTFLGWQNRDVTVRVQVGDAVWNGHLWAVLVVGALLACWFLLGAAFVQCRLAERRRMRAGHQAKHARAAAPTAEPPPRPRPVRVGGAALQR